MSEANGIRDFFVERFRAEGTPERAAQERRYLKSSLEHYGVSVPRIRALVKELHRERKAPSREALIGAARALWGDGHHESRSAAIALLERYRRSLGGADLDLVEELLVDCATWAHVDWLAPHVAGELVARFPKEGAARLDTWARHPSFWVRRAAMLALLVPIRRGDDPAAFERFSRYAAAMLAEEEFFIRQAIGWVLREASKKRPEWTARFLETHAKEASALTFREGARKLPDDLRHRLERVRAERT